MSQKQFKRLRKQLKENDVDLKQKVTYTRFASKKPKLARDPTTKNIFVVDAHTVECTSIMRKTYQETKRILKTGQNSRLYNAAHMMKELEDESFKRNNAAAEKDMEALADRSIQSPNEEPGSKAE